MLQETGQIAKPCFPATYALSIPSVIHITKYRHCRSNVNCRLVNEKQAMSEIQIQVHKKAIKILCQASHLMALIFLTHETGHA